MSVIAEAETYSRTSCLRARLRTSAAVLENGSRSSRTSSTTFVSISSFIFPEPFVPQIGQREVRAGDRAYQRPHDVRYVAVAPRRRVFTGRKDDDRTMLKDGILPLEKIAQYSNLPLDEVRRIASEQSNSGPTQHMEDITKWK